MSGPHLFTIFLNDLELSLNGKDNLFKYADDTSIVSLVWKEQDNSMDIVKTFMEWSEKNCMSSNRMCLRQFSAFHKLVNFLSLG